MKAAVVASVAAAFAVTAVPASHAEPRHAVWLALPSIDGSAGAELGGERGIAPRQAVVVAVSVRQTAAGDYDAVRLGIAGEYRWYWRGGGGWARIAGLERTGWFTGGRVDLAASRLSMDERHVGTLVSAGARAELGYRLTPWRGLAITALVGVGGNVDRDTDGRLPLEAHRLLGFGLDLGWMF